MDDVVVIDLEAGGGGDGGAGVEVDAIMEEVACEEPVAAAQDLHTRIEQPAIEATLDQPSGSRALVASAGASSRQVHPDASIDDVLKAWDELKAREVNAHSMKIVS